MASFSTSPTLIVPGAQTRVTFSPSSGNFLRVWITDAPEGSDEKAELKKRDLGRLRIDSLDEKQGPSFEWTFTPKKGGQYLLAIQEYDRGTNFGGGFGDDADAQRHETLNGPEDTSQIIRVAQRLTQRVGTAADSATLVVYVSDTTIVQTTVDVHGEKTPALIDPVGPRAQAAIQSTTVAALVDALVDTVASTSAGSLSTTFTDLATNFNAHLTQGSVHSTNDTAHALDADYYSPNSPAALQEATKKLAENMRLHFENQDEDQFGVGSKAYHSAADWANRLEVQPAADVAVIASLIANMHLSYEAHRQNGTIHATADSTNNAAVLSAILKIHSAFIAELSQTNPTAPDVVNDGAAVLVSGLGFEEKDF